jgi:uncharacterized protein DUF6411
MLIAAVIGFCVLVFLVAVIAPRFSRRVESAGDRPLGAGQRTAGHAPGLLGRWFQKPFGKSRKAVHESGSAGRRSRFKLPF